MGHKENLVRCVVLRSASRPGSGIQLFLQMLIGANAGFGQNPGNWEPFSFGRFRPVFLANRCLNTFQLGIFTVRKPHPLGSGGPHS